MTTYNKIDIEAEKILRSLTLIPSIVNIEEEDYWEETNNICACNPDPDIEDNLKNWGA